MRTPNIPDYVRCGFTSNSVYFRNDTSDSGYSVILKHNLPHIIDFYIMSLTKKDPDLINKINSKLLRRSSVNTTLQTNMIESMKQEFNLTNDSTKKIVVQINVTLENA